MALPPSPEALRTDDAYHLPATGRCDSPRVQSVRGLMQRRCARTPYLMDHGQLIDRVLIRKRFD